MMSATKIIAIVVLLVLGANLLMFGYLRRRIAAALAEARRQEGRSPDGETPPGTGPSESPDADQNGRL